jgi:hypothetical protein
MLASSQGLDTIIVSELGQSLGLRVDMWHLILNGFLFCFLTLALTLIRAAGGVYDL